MSTEYSKKNEFPIENGMKLKCIQLICWNNE